MQNPIFYLILSVIVMLGLRFIYWIIGYVYEQNSQNIKSKKIDIFFKLFHYAIVVYCIAIVIFWRGAEPPVIDLSKIQVSEGIVECKNSTTRGIHGFYKMDGIRYVETFSYLFGIGNTLPCFNELNRQHVKLFWISIYNGKERLLMEVRDIQTNKLYGLSVKESYINRKREIDDKSSYYILKLFLIGYIIYMGYELLKPRRANIQTTRRLI